MSLAVVGLLARDPTSTRLARASLLVTLEASTVEANVGDAKLVVDRTGCLVMPAQTTVTLRSRTPAGRIALLGFGDALTTECAGAYAKLGFDPRRLARWTSRVERLERTVWIHEIVHRYVFEREALEEHDNLATRFLEVEILKEIYFLFRDRDEGADRANAVAQHSPTVARALAWIEAHLFDPPDIKELARRSSASESTLLRSFRRELGTPPAEYWRTRRLDESLVLLRSGRYAIAELATRAGYDNPTSFGHAFRQRFGRPPSHFLRARPTRRAP